MYTSFKDSISKFSFADKSHLFAWVNLITDKNPPQSTDIFKLHGASNVVYISQGNNHGYYIEGDYDIVVSIRGTMMQNPITYLEDIEAALGADTTEDNKLGFYKAADNIWSQLEGLLRAAPQKTLWLTGHSLGAAASLIVALKIVSDKTLPQIKELYTYGCPRTLNKEQLALLPPSVLTHYRWVNNADVITTLPPTFEGYHHHGDEWYLNYWGNVRTLTTWQRIKDQWRGVLAGFKHGKLDPAIDHLIMHYVTRLHKYSEGKEFPQDKL